MKINLLKGERVDPQVFRGNDPEVLFMTADNKKEETMLFTQTRQFLRQRGLKIGDSEPISLQVLCRDPNGNSKTKPLSFIFIRKSCSFAEALKVTSVFVI